MVWEGNWLSWENESSVCRGLAEVNIYLQASRLQHDDFWFWKHRHDCNITTYVMTMLPHYWVSDLLFPFITVGKQYFSQCKSCKLLKGLLVIVQGSEWKARIWKSNKKNLKKMDRVFTLLEVIVNCHWSDLTPFQLVVLPCLVINALPAFVLTVCSHSE